MNQLKLVTQKMLTNDLIIVTIDSSKITFITYKSTRAFLTDQQFKQKPQKTQRDIPEDFQEVELAPTIRDKSS